MSTRKQTAIGTSTRMFLPKEMLVKEGDTMYVVEMPDGYYISPVDQETAVQVEIAREGMKRFRETLAKLAK